MPFERDVINKGLEMMMPYYRMVVETPIPELRHRFIGLSKLPYYAWTNHPTSHNLTCAVDGCKKHTNQVCILCSLALSKVIVICLGHRKHHLSLNPPLTSLHDEDEVEERLVSRDLT
jgi:hypothetical protein